jgi:hypothetical protein
LLDCGRYKTHDMCPLVLHVIWLLSECSILLLELGEEVLEVVSGNGYWAPSDISKQGVGGKLVTLRNPDGGLVRELWSSVRAMLE